MVASNVPKGCVESALFYSKLEELKESKKATRWAQETQNVAAKSVFKMAGGYFPRGGRGQITFLLC